MNLPWKKKFVTTHDWQYEPYAFVPGMKYIIEINRDNITMEQIKALGQWIDDNGLNIKLVISKGDKLRALQPIEVRHMTEVIK